MKLTVELIPQTSWGHNVRSEVSKAEWDVIRRKCYEAAGYVCEICGGVGKRHPVECHEIWEFDESTRIQTLVGFVALCPQCHRVKHLGRTFSMGFGTQALKHMAHVNGTTIHEAGEYAEAAFNLWQRRSLVPWTVDISFSKKY